MKPKFVVTAILAATCVALAAQEAQRKPLAASDLDLVTQLVMLEDTRTFDEPVLARALKAEHPEVRRRGALAVARIVNPAGSRVLAPYRADPDIEVRATVVFAAGQLKDAEAVTWLSELLMAKDTPTPVAREAAQALGKIRTPAARTALAQYLSTVQDSKDAATTVGEALLAIGRFTTREDITPIVRWASHKDPQVRWRATWALVRPRDPAAMSQLFALSDDASPEVRFWAVRGLFPHPGSSADDLAKASARLRAAVRDPDRQVRTEALRALIQFDDDASVQVLLAALDSDDVWMSCSAAESVHRFKAQRDQVISRLIAATAPNRPLCVRAAAALSLSAVSEEAAVDAAALLIRSPQLVARTTAMQILQKRTGEAGRAKLEALGADPATKDLVAPQPSTPGSKPTPPARTLADYRRITERWIVTDYNGAAKPRAILTTPRGEIELELYPGDAPLGVEYFFTVVESGAIVGTEFGRVVPNFVAQQRAIAGATVQRDEVNRRGLTPGNLSWASAGLDTGRPGYTLGVTAQPHNEGDFTALGRIVRGMDVLERLELGDAVTGARLVRP